MPITIPKLYITVPRKQDLLLQMRNMFFLCYYKHLCKIGAKLVKINLLISGPEVGKNTFFKQ